MSGRNQSGKTRDLWRAPKCAARPGSLLWLFLPFLCLLATAQENFDLQRAQMVRNQLMKRDIRDAATIRAMEKVPRHQFVPETEKDRAYTDAPLPIGEGQTISQPYIVAFMTQALKLQPQDKVLEIGTGSGYQAAVLAEIVQNVYTMEIVKSLGLAAEKRLEGMGYSNIHVKIGDGYGGWPEKAPFDAIMVTAGAESLPPALLGQLRDGGRLIIPIGPHHGIRQLKLYHKNGAKVRERDLMAVRFVPFKRSGD